MIIEAGRSWLHPVVSPLSNDIAPPHNSFDFNFSCEIKDYKYIVKATLLPVDTYLSSLISSGDASAFLHIECPGTYFRRLVTFDSSFSTELAISVDDVRGLTQFLAAITAVRPITDYRHPRQSEEYEGAVFQVGEGDFLAVSHTKALNLFPDLDPVQSFTSIIDVKKGSDDLQEPYIDLHGQTITIVLPAEEMEHYAKLRTTKEVIKILIASAIFPAVLQALFALNKLESDDLDRYQQERKWARLLFTRLYENGFTNPWTLADEEECFKAALFLLKNPLKSALTQVSELLLGGFLR